MNDRARTLMEARIIERSRANPPELAELLAIERRWSAFLASGGDDNATTRRKIAGGAHVARGEEFWFETWTNLTGADELARARAAATNFRHQTEIAQAAEAKNQYSIGFWQEEVFKAKDDAAQIAATLRILSLTAV